MAKALQLEGNKSKNLLNKFNFVDQSLPDIVEEEIEVLKFHMIHNPIGINICGMFMLNYFILYAVISHCAFCYNTDKTFQFSDNSSGYRIFNYVSPVSNGCLIDFSDSIAQLSLVTIVHKLSQEHNR